MTTAAETAARLGVDPAALASATGADPARVAVRPMPPVVEMLTASWVAAIATPRVIFLRAGAEPTARLLAHELAHSAQWRRWGRAGFVVRYVAGFLAGLARSRSWRQAYESVPAEVEARHIADRWAA